MRRRICNASITLLVLLQLTLATGASFGLMLCVEPDGRSAVESVFGADCCAPRHAQVQLDVTTDQLACDCVDVPLLFSATAMTTSVRDTVVPLLVMSPVRIPARASARVLGRSRGARLPDFGSTPNLLARRSIVLLV